VPIVKATIEGREYSFAPLTWDQLDQIAEDPRNEREGVKRWFPLIKDSAERAGSEVPNLGPLDLDRFNVAFPAAVEAVKKASGMVALSPGEKLPGAA
jgi:hypothetical protein